MGKESNIQWTDHTWNIAVGCTKVDEDCKYCYMYRDSLNGTRYDPKDIRRTKTRFNLPLTIKEPSKIFTCSLTDFFHEAIDGYRDEAWDIIRRCQQHTFQILTKRPERIAEHLPGDWGDGWNHVWLGTSCGSMDSMHRVSDLLNVKSKTLFLSLEPLHGPIYLQDFLEYNRIGWVIVGGESGNDNGKYRYRPCDIKWIEKIVYDCKRYKVPVFVKQLGTHLSKQLNMSDRHGGDITEFPEQLKIREFPKC